MLITLKNNAGKLVIKDVLDIDFDMIVEKNSDMFYVRVNNSYKLNETFENETDAEDRMIHVADVRNTLENELRNY